MAEQFFNRIADDVQKASEHIQTRFEEGWSILSTGTLSKTHQQQPLQEPNTVEESADINWENELDLEGLSEEELRELIESQEDLMEHNPLQGIADGVMGDIMARNMGPQTPMEHFHAFRSAVTWNEPFILGLVVFQAIMFMLCLYVSRRDKSLAPRVVMLMLIGGIVRSAEYLNHWASQHWEEFATQNYFDKRGIFVAIMVSGPLLLDSLIMLFLFVSEAGSLLVQVKKEEIKRSNNKKNKDQSRSSNNNNQDGRTKTQKQD